MPWADVSLLCVQMQTKTIHRRAARGRLRDTLRQKTASSKVNVGGMFGDRDRKQRANKMKDIVSKGTSIKDVFQSFIRHTTHRTLPAGSQMPPSKASTGGQDTVQQFEGDIPGIGCGKSCRSHRLPGLLPRWIAVKINLPVPDGSRRAI